MFCQLQDDIITFKSFNKENIIYSINASERNVFCWMRFLTSEEQTRNVFLRWSNLETDTFVKATLNYNFVSHIFQFRRDNLGFWREDKFLLGWTGLLIRSVSKEFRKTV